MKNRRRDPGLASAADQGDIQFQGSGVWRLFQNALLGGHAGEVRELALDDGVGLVEFQAQQVEAKGHTFDTADDDLNGQGESAMLEGDVDAVAFPDGGPAFAEHFRARGGHIQHPAERATDIFDPQSAVSSAIIGGGRFEDQFFVAWWSHLPSIVRIGTRVDADGENFALTGLAGSKL